MQTDSFQKDFRQYFKFWMIPAFMLGTALACLPFLPVTIPTQWDANWNPHSWGAKWNVLLFPLFDAVLFPFLEFLFAGVHGRYPGFGGSRVESDPKGFYYLCFLILSLGCYAMETFMAAEGFYGSVHAPRFLLAALCGAAIVMTAVYSRLKRHASELLEIVGLLVMTTNLIR